MPTLKLNSDRVRMEMALRGWTVKDLSRESGVPTSTITYALRDATGTTYVTANRIAKAFEDHPSDPRLAGWLKQ